MNARLKSEIIHRAEQAAILFCDECGDFLDPEATDWDATAWETDRPEIARKLGIDIEEPYGDEWKLYQEILIAETRRIAIGYPATPPRNYH